MATPQQIIDPDDLATQLLVNTSSHLAALRLAEEVGSTRSPTAKSFAMAAAIIRGRLHLEWKAKGYAA